MNKSSKSIAVIACITAALLSILLMTSSLFNALPYGALIFGIIVVLYEIALPLEIIKYFGMKPRDFNIYAHRIDTLLDIPFPPYQGLRFKPDYLGLYQELIVLVKVSVVILIPYCFFYGAFFQWLALYQGGELLITAAIPERLWYEALVQIFVVALPEEFFYRGFLQASLLKQWPEHHKVFYKRRAVLLTNVFFALSHIGTTWSPWRLLTFFPGLIFSYLTIKNKSIFSSILFHALCNIIGLILFKNIIIR